MNPKAIEDLELRLLLEAVFERYGYDFRNYAKATLRRRVARRLHLSGLNHVSELLPLFLHDPAVFDLFLKDMSVTVTEMFRDPAFYRALRTRVVPVLRSYPRLKIWHAGCATGEEVYSTAILMHEEGLLDRCQFYATDYNRASLSKAAAGIYSEANLQEWAANYARAGGTGQLSDYYTLAYGSGKIHERLGERIAFSFHNLCSDASFGEMHLILCRNVMIYFDRELQARVVDLFDASLCNRGFLCLGTKETLDFTPVADEFDRVAEAEKIYRRRTVLRKVVRTG